ncbi:MAG TPA: MarR family winged helix-turn-helix transcriptional regulator [Devosiaceae bacterium]
MDAPAAKALRTRRPVDSSALAGTVGYRLRLAQLTVFQDFIETFEELDIRPADYAVLLLIGDNPGCKQGEIAAALGIKRANFVALMNRIEERGLAERRARSSDRRSHALHLTDKGAQFVERMKELQTGHEARLVAALGGEADRDRFLSYLERIIEGKWTGRT